MPCGFSSISPHYFDDYAVFIRPFESFHNNRRAGLVYPELACCEQSRTVVEGPRRIKLESHSQLRRTGGN